MKLSSLRRVSEADVCARNAMITWPEYASSLIGEMAYVPLPECHDLVFLEAYRDGICWRACIDLYEWLMLMAPDMLGLVYGNGGPEAHLHADSHMQARKLFAATEKPVTMPFSELDYELLIISENAPIFPKNTCLLMMRTAQGRIWFSDYPRLAMPGRRDILRSLATVSLPMSWRIGYSMASVRVLKTMRRGDVLLMLFEAFDLVCSGKSIAYFSINENGEVSLKNSINQREPDVKDVEADDERSSLNKELSDISLKMDFILHRRMTTLEQLERLYCGQVFPLDPQAEQQIEIAVNGTCIAKGELVEVNGRLGVELQDVFVGRHVLEKNRVK